MPERSRMSMSSASPASTLDADVAIVGYGPMGQALATLLGPGGRPAIATP
jgi:hypothetical protein